MQTALLIPQKSIRLENMQAIGNSKLICTAKKNSALKSFTTNRFEQQKKDAWKLVRKRRGPKGGGGKGTTTAKQQTSFPKKQNSAFPKLASTGIKLRSRRRNRQIFWNFFSSKFANFDPKNETKSCFLRHRWFQNWNEISKFGFKYKKGKKTFKIDKLFLQKSKIASIPGPRP